MKLLAEIIDFKITFLYSFMLLFFNFVDMEKSLKLLTALIFVGYNLHRWYIMHQADKREKAKHKPRNRRS
ncbi:hypothetical protein ACM55F_09950 [Flavobacterium sp. XS2P12]|uniref:hypothetical protein n=1 Tax=Flavobacterium melibiosi TaxID=3398734 RepID=UPI003A8C8415